MDPYTRLIEALVEEIARRVGEDELKVLYLLQIPREEHGDVSFPAIRYRRKGVDPERLAAELEEALKSRGIDYASVSVAGPGYINVKLDARRLVEEVSSLYRRTGSALEVPKTKEPLTLVVEHTSANPIHPMHMGHARNMSLGDTLARLLRARGHRVNTRFYVDDVGKQVAVAALGVRILGIDPVEEARRLGVKGDDLVGWIYAVTHLSVDIIKAKHEGNTEKVESLLPYLVDLKDRDPAGYFDRIVNTVWSMEDPEAEISRIMRNYELGREEEKRLIRRMVEAVLEGFRKTLARMRVEFDAWDWESDMVWSSRVGRILEEARRSPYYTVYKGAEALDLPRFIKERLLTDPELAARIKLPRALEVPPLILRRSDGTTLYVTRDMAYTLYKFEVTGADRVYNVIGADQRLSQLQLRLALAALGYVREAVNTIHYDYELVSLPGERMSGRKGVLVKLDDILDGLKNRAAEEVRARNPGASEEWVEETAEKIARAAVRFRLVQVSAPKPIVFDPEKALDLTANSGPYLQYTHARASSILRKLGGINYSVIDPSACSSGKRRRLLVLALRMPLTAAKAADDLAPEILAVYLIGLADLFNSWYQEDSVLHEPDEGAKHCKALLVALVREALARGLELLGIDAPERM
ncbi:MAG: arginine--tRNA ligase [Desulfurococcales archaeon]|nr:arginine--tRNA ligase [Desulfurococcales archaeon]